MKQEYIDYWKKHHPPCVGTSRIGKGRVCSVHADGTTRTGPWWTRFVPSRYITFNKKGLCIDISTTTRVSNNRTK